MNTTEGTTMKRSVITDQAVVIDIEADGESILFDIEGEDTFRFTVSEAERIGRALLEVAAKCSPKPRRRSRR